MVDSRIQLSPGERVPGTPYRVVDLVGCGGMGSVYSVEHETLGRRFVLKILHQHLAQRRDLVARMQNEWRALAKLHHPHIVQVTDAGQTSGLLPYYVMEQLVGENLGSCLARRGRLGPGEAGRILVDVLDGLSAAHGAGAIHRDVKPQNIFVLDNGRAKLLDFGIAKLRDATARVVTAGGVSIGTPRYMAPEQAEGTDVDGRADLYAAGLVLFEALVGRGPFAHIRDPNELVMAHLALEPERADRLQPSVPEEWADLVARWLSKRREDRPASARHARQELLALVESLVEAPHEHLDVTIGGAVYDASTVGAREAAWESPSREATSAIAPAPASSAAAPRSSRDLRSEAAPRPGGASKSRAPAAPQPWPTTASLAIEAPAPSTLRDAGSIREAEDRPEAGTHKKNTLAWGTAPEADQTTGWRAVQRPSSPPAPPSSKTPPPLSSTLAPRRPQFWRDWSEGQRLAVIVGGVAVLSFGLAWSILTLLTPQAMPEASVSAAQPESAVSTAPKAAETHGQRDAPGTPDDPGSVKAQAPAARTPDTQDTTMGVPAPPAEQSENGDSAATEPELSEGRRSGAGSAEPGDVDGGQVAPESSASVPPAAKPAAPAPAPARKSTATPTLRRKHELPGSGLW